MRHFGSGVSIEMRFAFRIRYCLHGGGALEETVFLLIEDYGLL